MVMQTFVSSISGKSFSNNEKITGAAIRNCIVEEIKKAHPNFTETSVISVQEVDEFRQKYIQNTLTNELGDLDTLEKTVLEHLQKNELISDHLNEDNTADLTLSQRWADNVAAFGGSWRFIILFAIIIFIWIVLNVIVLANKPFDAYPFILLNLILSCVAALQAPVIMMSQNRQEEKDRERSKNDYMINLKSEMEIRMLHEKIDHLIVHQQKHLMEIQQVQIDMMNDIMQRLPLK